jgi:hypothetical protein
MTGLTATVLPGGHSEWEPPDPFSNSEVKTLCADASVDFVDVKVGHCQALDSRELNPHQRKLVRVFRVFLRQKPSSKMCRDYLGNDVEDEVDIPRA